MLNWKERGTIPILFLLKMPNHIQFNDWRKKKENLKMLGDLGTWNSAKFPFLYAN
jgi:hypothetical protein